MLLAAVSLAVFLPRLGDLTGSAGAQTAAPPGSRPNVMVVLMDDMRGGEDSMVAMPNVIRWMRQGGTEFPEGT